MFADFQGLGFIEIRFGEFQGLVFREVAYICIYIYIYICIQFVSGVLWRILRGCCAQSSVFPFGPAHFLFDLGLRDLDLGLLQG